MPGFEHSALLFPAIQDVRDVEPTIVSGRLLVSVSAIVALLATPSPASAQASPDDTRPWIVVGGGSTTLLGDCTDCVEGKHQHTGGLLINAGASLSQRTDVGVEVLWVPAHLPTGEDLRSTFVMAAVQFRPWRASGFFVKAGVGTAFIRNWVVDFEQTGRSASVHLHGVRARARRRVGMAHPQPLRGTDLRLAARGGARRSQHRDGHRR